MADIKSSEQRSKNMSAIRSRDTKPEIYFRKLLFSKGYRYRIADKNIPGHPDMFLRRFNTAVFIHGCFWHRHNGCRYSYTPKSRIDFWKNKFSANTRRDEVVKQELEARKIKCLIIWECTIKGMKRSEEQELSVLAKSINFINSDALYLEL